MKKYENFVSNLAVLGRAEQEDLDNEFIISGIIDKFFLQFELGWKLFKELLRYVYDFVDEEVWLSMLKARNDMTHIYDGAAAKQMVGRILEQYLPAFIKVQEALEERYGDLSKEDL